MNINANPINPPFFNRAATYLSNRFSSLRIDEKITVIGLGIFALYLTFCTCRYFYNLRKLEDGQGKTIDFFGYVQEGEFKDGKLNGQGRKEYFMGGVQEGEFKDGELNGQGKDTFFGDDWASKIFGFRGDCVREGEFKDGRLHGKGTLQAADYKKYFFFGDFIPGHLAEGTFEHGDLNGNGEITYPGERTEEGEFKDSLLHGQGKRTYDNGKVEEGAFKNGSFVG